MMSCRPLILDAFLPYRLSVASNAVSTRISNSYRRRFGLPKEYPMMAPRLIRTRGRVSELDPITFRRLSIGPVERDARFDGEPH